MKTVFTIVTMLLFTYQFLFSQNLVPNPSFERGQDICDPVTNISKYEIYVCDWICGSPGTSDILSTQLYYKTCYSSIPYNGTDSNLHPGSQIPRTGNRVAGIYTFDYTNPAYPVSYREYIEVKLNKPLIPGEYYCAEMYVSPGESFPCYTNSLGMYLSDSLVVGGDIDYLSVVPQIVENNIISDTVNWIRVSGTFKATSALQYLVIGNFYDNDHTLTSCHYDRYFSKSGGYYFIDDVSVEHLPKKELIPLPDQEICKGDSITLMIPGFDNVTWTTLQDTVTVLHSGGVFKILPDTTTQYRMTIRNCNLTVKDTVSVTVDLFLKVKLGPDTTICQGSTLRLDAGTLLGSAYQWQNNSTDQYFTAHEAGTYSVNVSNPFNDCVGHDAIDVSILNPPKVDLGRDTLVCQNFFPLKAGSGYPSYSWSTGSSDSIFTPQNAGNYWVTVKNRCGQAADSIDVFSVNSIFLPNVVTQNNDAYNNEFRVVVKNSNDQLDLQLPVEGKLTVYNRWGGQVFWDDHYLGGWPSGQSNLDAAVYYVTFSYSACPAVKGWVQVMK